MRKMNKSTVGKIFSGLLFAGALAFLIPSGAKAAMVHASGVRGSQDRRNIEETLAVRGSATFESGKTYYLDYPIELSSGDKIYAKGATIICYGGIAFNAPTTTGYSAVKNASITGGTWKCSGSSGYSGSAIKLAHCSNITLSNMNIRVSNYDSHNIELVACKNVHIYGCTISGVGKSRKNSIEEQIQLDVASPRTAAYLKQLYRYRASCMNGAPCQNIYIQNCKVTGNRGICANYSKDSAGKYHKFHKNIVIKNSTIIGRSAEGVALFNTMSGKVIGNTITSKSSRTGTAYSVGCHIAQMFKAPAAIRKAKIVVRGNKIHGGRQALNFETHKNTKYGTIIVKNNKLFCKKGAKNALHINTSKTVRHYKEAGNKMKKW